MTLKSDIGCPVSTHPPTLATVRNPELHTPVRSIRMDEERWARLGGEAGPRGRSALINDLVAWYLREPGAKQPKRPE